MLQRALFFKTYKNTGFCRKNLLMLLAPYCKISGLLCVSIPSKQFNLYRKETRRTTKQRIGALRGADPKFRTDSESSSVEEGDSGTRSSFEEDSTECENSSEPIDSQDSAANENTIVVFNIPDSIKQLLEEDGIKIKSRKKVCINYQLHYVLLSEVLRFFFSCLNYLVTSASQPFWMDFFDIMRLRSPAKILKRLECPRGQTVPVVIPVLMLEIPPPLLRN